MPPTSNPLSRQCTTLCIAPLGGTFRKPRHYAINRGVRGCREAFGSVWGFKGRDINASHLSHCCESSEYSDRVVACFVFQLLNSTLSATNYPFIPSHNHLHISSPNLFKHFPQYISPQQMFRTCGPICCSDIPERRFPFATCVNPRQGRHSIGDIHISGVNFQVKGKMLCVASCQYHRTV